MADGECALIFGIVVRALALVHTGTSSISLRGKGVERMVRFQQGRISPPDTDKFFGLGHCRDGVMGVAIGADFLRESLGHWSSAHHSDDSLP